MPFQNENKQYSFLKSDIFENLILKVGYMERCSVMALYIHFNKVSTGLPK